MKKVLCIVAFALSIMNCPAATLKVCKYDLYVDCVSKLGPFFTTAVNTGSHGYTRGLGNYNGTRTWQWRTATTLGNGADNYATSGDRIDGIHVCSNTDGTYGHIGAPAGLNGKYCWCKMTGINGSNCAGAWVFLTAFGDADKCSNGDGTGIGYNGCAYGCAYGVNGTGAFRAAVLTLP